MEVTVFKYVFFAVVLVLLAATSCIACMCGDTRPSVAEARDNALMVFSGRVVDDEYRDGASFPDGKPAGAELVARFKIDRWWKGDHLPEIFLFTEQFVAADHSISVSDCAYRFEVGKRYLVYAGFFLGRLRAIYCSRTAEIAKATEDLKILGNGTPPARRRRASHTATPNQSLDASRDSVFRMKLL
jgi:hypothetical protein